MLAIARILLTLLLLAAAPATMLGCKEEPPAKDEDFIGAWEMNPFSTKPLMRQSLSEWYDTKKKTEPASVKNFTVEELNAIADKATDRLALPNNRYDIRSDKTYRIYQTRAVEGKPFSIASRGTWSRTDRQLTLTPAPGSQSTYPITVTRQGTQLHVRFQTKSEEVRLALDPCPPGLIDADVYGFWVIDIEASKPLIRASIQNMVKLNLDKDQAAKPLSEAEITDSTDKLAKIFSDLQMVLQVKPNSTFVMGQREPTDGSDRKPETRGTWVRSENLLTLKPNGEGLSAQPIACTIEGTNLRIMIPMGGNTLPLLMKPEPLGTP